MGVYRTVSGAFSIIVGDHYDVLEELSHQGVKNRDRIVGFTLSGAGIAVMYGM